MDLSHKQRLEQASTEAMDKYCTTSPEQREVLKAIFFEGMLFGMSEASRVIAKDSEYRSNHRRTPTKE